MQYAAMRSGAGAAPSSQRAATAIRGPPPPRVAHSTPLGLLYLGTHMFFRRAAGSVVAPGFVFSPRPSGAFPKGVCTRLGGFPAPRRKTDSELRLLAASHRWRPGSPGGSGTSRPGWHGLVGGDSALGLLWGGGAASVLVITAIDFSIEPKQQGKRGYGAYYWLWPRGTYTLYKASQDEKVIDI